MLDRGHIGHIQPSCQVVAGLGGETFRHLVCCILIKVGNRHLSPFLGQPEGTCPTDAVSSTGDDRCRTREACEMPLRHRSSLPRPAEAAYPIMTR
jgi:hypothetical protein